MQFEQETFFRQKNYTISGLLCQLIFSMVFRYFEKKGFQKYRKKANIEFKAAE